MDYYYRNLNSVRVGPLDEATFFAHVNAGYVSAGTLVWRSGEPAWMPWASVAAAWINGSVGVPAAEEADASEGEVVSDDIGIDALFGESWTVFKRHWGKFLSFGLICSAASFCSEFVRAWSGFRQEFSETSSSPEISLVALVLSLLSAVISGGLMFGSLKIVRKEDAGTPVSFGDIFPLGRMFVKVLKFFGIACVWFAGVFAVYFPAAMLLFSASASDPVALIFLFAVFPAELWLLTRFAFVGYFIFDTDCGVFASFRASWRATRGKFWRSLGYGVLTILLVVFGSLFTLGLGSVLLAPLSMIWGAVYYVKLRKTCGDSLPACTLAETAD